MWQSLPEILTQVRQRQENPWCSLVSQCNLLDEPQVLERDAVSKDKVHSQGLTPKAGLHRHMYAHTHTYTPAITEMCVPMHTHF